MNVQASTIDPRRWARMAGALYLLIIALGLVFFGITCLVEGQLIARSGFLPALIGRGMQLPDLCYLTNSSALIVVPDLADRMFPVILLPPFFAELSFAGWLLEKGVDVEKWQARARSIHGDDGRTS